MKTGTRNFLINFYEDFLINFLTVEAYAQVNGLTAEETKFLLKAGQKYREMNVESSILRMRHEEKTSSK